MCQARTPDTARFRYCAIFHGQRASMATQPRSGRAWRGGQTPLLLRNFDEWQGGPCSPNFAYFFHMKIGRLGLILLGPLICTALLLLGAPEDMQPSAFAALAITSWIACWWLTEAVPIAVTALLPLILFPLAGVMTMGETSEPYARPIIFLFIGGFIVALAMEKWNLHRRIALTIIAAVGTNKRTVLLGFIVATWFLSMWISNTATTVMMLPIALSIIHQFEHFDTGADRRFGLALVLSLAYAASIGGIATLVGTPTNLIFADAVQDLFAQEIAFDRWMLVGFPISCIMMLCLYMHLSTFHFQLDKAPVPGGGQIIQQQLKGLGPMSKEEKRVLVVFCLVALAWITRQYLIAPLMPRVNDTTIALVGAVSLFVIPGSAKQEALMDWKTALRLPWGVLLLFGGAFAVAESFEVTGLTQWIGDRLSGLRNVPFWVVLTVVVVVVNYLTEITQNMATCTLMMPIMAALSGVLDAHPFGLMVGTCIASSCAFMLPVATAPNAVVFGSGLISVSDMARAGFLLNIIAIIVISLFMYYLFPLLWDLDLQSYPPDLRRF